MIPVRFPEFTEADVAELAQLCCLELSPEDTGLATALDCARALAVILTTRALEDPAQLRSDMTITLADGTRRTVVDLDLASHDRTICGDCASDLPETSHNADDDYLPEPDLPPLRIEAARLARIRGELSRADPV